MIRRSLLAALFTTTAATAYAAGPEIVPIEPVVIVPVAPFWAGGYVGGQIGYGYGDFDIGGDIGDLDSDSLIGGVMAGYLWEVAPSWYLGPEFQYDWADDITITDPDTGGSLSLDSLARLKLIVGYEVGNGLIFGSAGVAYADFGSFGDVLDGLDGDETNYTLGIGYDYRVGDNWTVGGEYQYMHFNNVGDAGEDVDVNGLYFRAAYRF